jgi:integrase
VDLYVDRRRRGEVSVDGREGKPVRPRVLEQDCSLLKAVLNWATDAGDGAGGTLLDRNPIARYKVPREKTPQRAVLTTEQFRAVRAAAAAVSASLELFAVMAWYTGHRSQSIRLLAWSDVDLEAGRIHWRGANDKVGNDHHTPIHRELLPFLARAEAVAGLTGDRWLFPSPRGASKPLTGNAVVNLWKRLAPVAGIPTGKRYGWHSFRRAFANNLRDVALRDLTDLGGWTTERTVVSVYQQPSEAAQRKALGALDSLAERAPRTGTSDT